MKKSNYLDARPAERIANLLGNSQSNLSESTMKGALQLVHPFPAPMSSSLIRLIIEAATNNDSVILDPMAGSGTVVTASRILGRCCYAFDIDPLARLMIRVSSAQQNIKEIEKAGGRVLQEAMKISSKKGYINRIFSERFDSETQEFINFWFPISSMRGLLALWLVIEKVPAKKVRETLALSFSKLIIAKTAGVSRAIDLPHSRPHRKIDKEVPDPLVMFPKRLQEVLKKLAPLAKVPLEKSLIVRNGDARCLPLQDSSIDLIVTSSPYANAIDYIRAHKFSLVWMGYSLSELRKLRAQMIGSEHSEPEIHRELTWLEDHLPNHDRKLVRRRSILRRYFYDMDRVLNELYRVLKPGGACVLVLGRSTVGKHVVDTPEIVARLAKRHGFEHIKTKYRQIDPSRRSLPFPIRDAKGNPLSKRIAEEAILALGR